MNSPTPLASLSSLVFRQGSTASAIKMKPPKGLEFVVAGVRIHLEEGQHKDVALRVAGTSSIHGVIKSPAAIPEQLTVSLRKQDVEHKDLSVSQRETVAIDGRFQFENVKAGHYVLVVQLTTGGQGYHAWENLQVGENEAVKVEAELLPSR